MLYVFDGWNDPSLFQTGWFVESLLTQTLIIHIIRTAKIPFLESRASAALIATSAIICAIGVVLPFTPAGQALKFTPLPPLYWPILLRISVDIRNTDPPGQNLVRPSLGHVNRTKIPPREMITSMPN